MIEFKPLTTPNILQATDMMKEFYAIDNYPFNAEKTSSLFANFIAQPHLGQCYLIYHNQNLCGYIIMIQFFSFEMNGMVMILDELYIKEDFRGLGIGKHAIDFAKNYAQENNLKKIVLEVELHNHKAISLYEKQGFKKHKRDLMVY